MYVKLFEDILDSTIWMEDHHVVRVFLMMLLKSDMEGYLTMPIPAIARRSRVTLSEAKDALERLQSPDEFSQSDEEEGRRVVRLSETEPIWFMVNKEKYRALRSADQKREYQKRYMREWRARKSREEKSNGLAYEDTDTDTDIHVSSVNTRNKEKKGKRAKPFKPPTPEEVQKYLWEKDEFRFTGRDVVEYYEANEWRDSKNNPVKNWKMKVLSAWIKFKNEQNVPQSDCPVCKSTVHLDGHHKFCQIPKILAGEENADVAPF
jgi:hypothetical protein